jgi:hypothetical protein
MPLAHTVYRLSFFYCVIDLFIVLLVCELFTPCVTLCCCLCHTALLYLTWLNKGEIKKNKRNNNSSLDQLRSLQRETTDKGEIH